MRLAANKVIIDGQLHANYVIELDDENHVIRHYPLCEELPHTQWYRTLIIESGHFVQSQR